MQIKWVMNTKCVAECLYVFTFNKQEWFLLSVIKLCSASDATTWRVSSMWVLTCNYLKQVSPCLDHCLTNSWIASHTHKKGSIHFYINLIDQLFIYLYFHINGMDPSFKLIYLNPHINHTYNVQIHNSEDCILQEFHNSAGCFLCRRYNGSWNHLEQSK